MLLDKKVRAAGSRFTRAALAGVLALGLAPASAFASDLLAAQELTPGTSAMDPSGYVIAAAYAAANPAPEILGLNNPSQRSDTEAEQTYNFFGDSEINDRRSPGCTGSS